MNIENFIDTLRQPNPIVQLIYNGKLKTQMQKLSEEDRGWRYFCYLLEKGNTGLGVSSKQDLSYSPDNILSLCLKLGIKTDEGLFSFVENMKAIDVDGLIDCHSPKLSIVQNNLREIDYDRLYSEILNSVICEKNVSFSPQMDSKYLLPHADEVDYILRQCPFDKLEYKAEGRDCDDYAFLLRAFLSENGYGNITIPYVTIYAYKDGKFAFAHAVNLLLYYNDTDDFIIQYLEPQSDIRWNVFEPMRVGLTKYDTKVRYILL